MTNQTDPLADLDNAYFNQLYATEHIKRREYLLGASYLLEAIDLFLKADKPDLADQCNKWLISLANLAQ